MTPTTDMIERARTVPICDVVRTKMRRIGQELVGPCPVCGGTDRFGINTKKNIFNCRGGCGGKGDVIAFMQHINGCDFAEAVSMLVGDHQPAGRTNTHPDSSTSKSRPVATWIYKDADEKPYLKVDRFDGPAGKKSYPQSHWDGAKWISGKPKGPKLPYRLPELLDSDRTEPVYICEGEKCADAVAKLGLAATSASEGAGKWTADLNEWFRDRIAYILPDNDGPGIRHAEKVAQNLAGIARAVRIVTLPALTAGEDVYDWIEWGGTREKLDALGDAAPKWQPDGIDQDSTTPLRQSPKTDEPKVDWRSMTTRARDLCDKRFPQLQFVLPGMIPEGVTLLAARPKIGKTWLLQQVSCAVAGNHAGTLGVTARQGDVLCLNLEDGDRRAQSRMTKYFGIDRNNWPERLTFASGWRRLDQGGIEDLREWCKSVEAPTLITIDTLKRVRPARGRTQTDYDADYDACRPLIDLCHEFPGLAIIVAHHDRKAAADDVFDTVSGTLGLSGGVDAIAMIKRNPQGLTLHIQGRDLEDTIEKVIEFDRETCRWQLLGDLSAIPPPDAKGRIIAALTASGQPMPVDAIMAAAQIKSRKTLEVTLSRLKKAGEITSTGRGMYVI